MVFCKSQLGNCAYSKSFTFHQIHPKRPFVLYVMNITACIGVLVEMDQGIKHPQTVVHPNHQVYQSSSITQY